MALAVLFALAFEIIEQRGRIESLVWCQKGLDEIERAVDEINPNP
jgi:hypothetical protein